MNKTLSDQLKRNYVLNKRNRGSLEDISVFIPDRDFKYKTKLNKSGNPLTLFFFPNP